MLFQFTQRSALALGVSIAASTFALSCSSPESTDTGMATAAVEVAPRVGTWSQSSGNVQLGSWVAGDACFLSEIWGHFAGGGEDVHLDPGFGGGGFTLTGKSGQSSLGAAATCVPTAAFSRPIYFDEGFSRQQSTDSSLERGRGLVASVVPLNRGADTACFLAGVRGQMGGFLNRVEVQDTVNGWNLFAGLSQPSYTGDGRTQGVYASCVSFPLVRNATETSPRSTAAVRYLGGAAGSIYEFVWTRGDQPKPMAYVTDGVCFLRSITGGFFGGGEHVRIANVGGIYYLEGDGAGVGATASCLSFDQG